MLIQSFLAAFAMYSAIPVRGVKWEEENHRYSLCFFPCIGLLVGGILILWYLLGSFLQVGSVLYGAIFTAIPIVITGGIHMDGFCDVIDAKASWQPKEKKLAIMSDSHIGAFALIYGILYFLVQFALFTEITELRMMGIAAWGCVQSRALSALAAVTFHAAKQEGSLQDFAKPAHKTKTVFVLSVVLVITLAGMCFLHPVCGAAAFVTGVFVMLYYRIMSYRTFGGITGDLAGYFVQVCEISVLAAVVLSDKIWGIFAL